MKTTQKRKRWAEQRGAIMEGRPLVRPAEAEIKYRQALTRLTERMLASYEKELLASLRTSKAAMNAGLGYTLDRVFRDLRKRWGAAYAAVSRKLVGDMISRVDRLGRTNLNQSLEELSGGLTIKTAKMPKGMADSIALATAENVALIRTIPDQFHDKIFTRVMESVRTAQSSGSHDIYQMLVTDLKSELVELGGSTKRRAELIARDQTSKITAEINSARMKSAGITKFKWRHSGGSADPRELHLEHDGKIFSFDDLPVIEYRKGVAVRGLPGQAINCRCQAIPVLDFSGDE